MGTFPNLRRSLLHAQSKRTTCTISNGRHAQFRRTPCSIRPGIFNEEEDTTNIYLPKAGDICILHHERPEGIKSIHLDVSSKEELEEKFREINDKYPHICVDEILDRSKDLGYTYLSFMVYIANGWGYEVRYRAW